MDLDQIKAEIEKLPASEITRLAEFMRKLHNEMAPESEVSDRSSPENDNSDR